MLSKYYHITTATGISVHLLPDGSADMHACAIDLKSKAVDITLRLTNCTSVEQLSKKLDNKSPVALNCSGKGILYKQVADNAPVDQHNFAKLFPNADINDFYVQQFISGDQSFIAVIRRVLADKWITEIEKYGFTVVMFSLGPFPVSHIIRQLNIYGNELAFDGYRITRDDQEHWAALHVDSTIENAFPIKIDVEPIDERLLIPYAAAFQLVLADKLDAIHAQAEPVEAALSKELSTRKLKAYAGVLLAVFFVVLLVNFVVLTNLTTENNRLSELASRSSQHDQDRQGQEENISKKERLLQTLGWDGGVRKSILIDDLAGLLPPGISWREVTINPIDHASEKSRTALQFKDRTIRVSGEAPQIIPLNEWIARIKTKKWVKNVQLDNYNYNNELNTGQFIVIINY